MIDEPVPGGDRHLAIFCFENGIVTGDGERRGLPVAIQEPYRCAPDVPVE